MTKNNDQKFKNSMKKKYGLTVDCKKCLHQKDGWQNDKCQFCTDGWNVFQKKSMIENKFPRKGQVCQSALKYTKIVKSKKPIKSVLI